MSGKKINSPGIGPTISCWSDGYRGSGSGFLALNLYPAEMAVSVTLEDTWPGLVLESVLLLRLDLAGAGAGWRGRLWRGFTGCSGSFLATELQLICLAGALLLYSGVLLLSRLDIPKEIWFIGLKKGLPWYRGRGHYSETLLPIDGVINRVGYVGVRRYGKSVAVGPQLAAEYAVRLPRKISGAQIGSLSQQFLVSSTNIPVIKSWEQTWYSSESERSSSE